MSPSKTRAFPHLPVVIVMAKAPRLGQGKQRLAATLGACEALRINRRLHKTTLKNAADRRWRTVLSVTPASAIHVQRPTIWPAHIARIPQGLGDLGARLIRAARYAGVAPIVLIGTDCPSLTPRRIALALLAARRDGAHAIPALDGGFVLFAARSIRILPIAFANVRWSSRHTLADVCANLAAHHQRISLSEALPDIDTEADWAAFVRKSRSCWR
jgi:rSAM/selenodomain-associated transferase 1